MSFFNCQILWVKTFHFHHHHHWIHNPSACSSFVSCILLDKNVCSAWVWVCVGICLPVSGVRWCRTIFHQMPYCHVNPIHKHSIQPTECDSMGYSMWDTRDTLIFRWLWIELNELEKKTHTHTQTMVTHKAVIETHFRMQMPRCVLERLAARVCMCSSVFSEGFIFTPLSIFFWGVFFLYLLILLKYNLHEFSYGKCRIIVLLLCYFFRFHFFTFFLCSKFHCNFFLVRFCCSWFFFEFSHLNMTCPKRNRTHCWLHSVWLLFCGRANWGGGEIAKDVCVCNLNCQLDVNVVVDEVCRMRMWMRLSVMRAYPNQSSPYSIQSHFGALCVCMCLTVCMKWISLVVASCPVHFLCWFFRYFLLLLCWFPLLFDPKSCHPIHTRMFFDSLCNRMCWAFVLCDIARYR